MSEGSPSVAAPPPRKRGTGRQGGGAFLLKRIDGLGLPNMFCIEFQGVT